MQHGKQITETFEEEKARMHGEGWRKEITLKKIVVKRGTIFSQEFDFFAENLPCRIREGGMSGPECGTNHSWVKVLNGKLFIACGRHKVVNGPISLNVGYKAIEEPISASDALEICRQTGQTPPPEVASGFQLEKAQEYRRRRRPE